MSNCKIVVYHYVRPIKNSQYKIKGMELDHFKKQIMMFKKKYNPIGIKDVIESINNNKTIPEPIGRAFPVSDISEAHNLLESRESVGKLAIEWK